MRRSTIPAMTMPASTPVVSPTTDANSDEVLTRLFQVGAVLYIFRMACVYNRAKLNL